MLRNMPEDAPADIGQLMRDSIERRGLSYREVARQVPISDTQLRNWLNGFDAKGQPVSFPDRRVARVAQILRFDPSTLRAFGRRGAAKILQQLIDDAEVAAAAAALSTEEIARQLHGMAKRLGDLERENEDLKFRLDEVEERDT